MNTEQLKYFMESGLTSFTRVSREPSVISGKGSR